MPNWCDNRLAIRGTPAEVQELVRVVDGDSPFDFDRIIPMPEQIRAGGDYDAPGVPDVFPGWYQWSREHWGVKWNSLEVSRRGYGRTGRVRYRFLTAYGPPTELLSELASRFPAIEFDLRFDIELWGDGRAAWRNGALVEYEEDVPW